MGKQSPAVSPLPSPRMQYMPSPQTSQEFFTNQNVQYVPMPAYAAAAAVSMPRRKSMTDQEKETFGKHAKKKKVPTAWPLV
eukprot:TRINITY_DN4957_c0_g1_i1.p1 TRINITY_DN4957_c0_g1~~TRINITY_DN4957_c0_g1_i1.p1  ORF type:complete len:81 (+),score=27.26 TRINITY_DN4957_c0_g1_i1:404-646(+)